MGSRVGHVGPGLAFFFFGLWHLFNDIKLHALRPNSYTSSTWFPIAKIRHLELYIIMAACSITISMELFIGPKKHQPLDTDGTIPTTHLHSFEHSLISLAFFTYAAFAIILDKHSPKTSYILTQFIAAVAFAQQLLLFHFHSADHMGIEAQYHLLLQCITVVSLTTTLMGIGLRKSFMVSFIRSISILYEGVWLITMGFMIWTPAFVVKDCFLHYDDGHQVISCSSDKAVHRGKSLVNILFSWILIIVTVFSIGFYIVVTKLYGEKIEYSTVKKEEETDEFGSLKKPRVYAIMDVEM